MDAITFLLGPAPQEGESRHGEYLRVKSELIRRSWIYRSASINISTEQGQRDLAKLKAIFKALVGDDPINFE